MPFDLESSRPFLGYVSKPGHEPYISSESVLLYAISAVVGIKFSARTVLIMVSWQRSARVETE